MIEPRLLTLQDLFADRIHYEVPIYQRPYVWDLEDQWLPLWEDIQEVTASRLSNGTANAHFLGAIVIELTSADPGRVKTFSVIDGQQRLTTLQLLLGALESIAANMDPERAADLAKMLRNQGRHVDGELVYKVWPGEYDRPLFRATIERGDDGQLPEGEEGIPGAFLFFREKIQGWLDETEDEEAKLSRLDALQDAVEGLLQVVAIQLDGSSDAQIIFETLNSRGADLTSLDLAKNSLFRQALRENDLPVSTLHADHWQPSLGDADYWLETVRQGRYTSERADLFLMHWLTMKTGSVARVQRLFADFRRLILRADPAPRAADIVIELSHDATIYRSFDGFDPTSIEGRFFRRLNVMETTTLIPVALLLFRSPDLSDQRRQRALRALESWLVRRMLLGATTAHYNRLLASVLSTLKQEATLEQADEVVIQTLRGFSNPTDQWPGDAEVRDRLQQQPLYGWINQKRIRMLLEACEHQIADTNRTEQIPLPSGLSIEHALPQTWRGHWNLPPDLDDEGGAENREAHVHLLGNLTLVTSALNSSLSNAEWPVKRLELAQRSQLLINQQLCAHESWDEASIDERGAELAAYVLETWPGPDADLFRDAEMAGEAERGPVVRDVAT